MLAKYHFGGMDPSGPAGDVQFHGTELQLEGDSDSGILLMLWRRKFLLLLCTLVAVGTTLFYVRRAIPIFSSTARISIEASDMRFMGQSFASPITPQFLATQAELIKSTKVVELAEAKLKVLKDAHGKPRILKMFVGQPRFVVALQENLTVQLDPKMNIIEVSFASPFADEAADIANVVVVAYKELHESETHHDSAELLAAAQAEKKKREVELADAVAKLNALRKDHSSLGTPEAFVARMTELSQAYTAAQIKVADAEASSGPNHPSIQAAIEHEKRLGEVIRRARDETAQAYSAREDLLQSQQDVNRLRDQADQADKLVKEAAAASSNPNGAARIILFEDAHVEASPIRPHKLQLLAIAGVLGMVLGAAAAIILDRMDKRISGPADVVSILRVPILGTVPLIKGSIDRGLHGQHVHLDPVSIASEAYRAIWKSICFGVPSAEGRTVVVTSPTAGDGKSTTAANLAIAMQQSGERVLLIDADVRRPMQHATFGLPNRAGLSTVLAGQSPVRQAIQRSAIIGLDVLTSGPTPSNPAEVFRRGRFELLLEEVASEYDRVIIDSPPVTTVSDTLTLAALCDITALVVRAGKSTRAITAAARDSLLSVGANLLGVVFNGSASLPGYRAYAGRPRTPLLRLPSAAHSGSPSLNVNTNGNSHSGAEGNEALSAELVVSAAQDASASGSGRPRRGHVHGDAF